MQDLLSLDQEEMQELLRKRGFPAFRGKQVFHWVHQKGATSFEAMTNLPHELRQALKEDAFITAPEVVRKSASPGDDTVKFLLKYPDGALVETVLMTYDRESTRDRNTVCVSTQVGCAMGCSFCATGLSGLLRNLTAGEILAQVWAAERDCLSRGLAGVTNVVFMGMGEPLANLEQVVKSIHLLNHDQGLHIGMRRITVSTCGIVPRIYQLADLDLPITLAISLHAPENELRSKIMPINQKFPLEKLMEAVDYYIDKTGRRVTFEYALFKGVNDGEKSARELGRLLQGKLVNVNLIPANPVPETGFMRPDPPVVKKFADNVAAYGVNIYIREEKGKDINAACGQLRRQITLQNREVQSCE